MIKISKFKDSIFDSDILDEIIEEHQKEQFKSKHMNPLIKFRVGTMMHYLDLTRYYYVSDVLTINGSQYEFSICGRGVPDYTVYGTDKEELENVQKKINDYLYQFLTTAYREL